MMLLPADSDTCNTDISLGLDENPGVPEQTNRVLTIIIIEDGTMRTLLASSTVLFTIVAALTFGIACGYAVIMGILRAMAHRPQPQQVTAPATAVIVTSASGS